MHSQTVACSAGGGSITIHRMSCIVRSAIIAAALLSLCASRTSAEPPVSGVTLPPEAVRYSYVCDDREDEEDGIGVAYGYEMIPPVARSMMVTDAWKINGNLRLESTDARRLDPRYRLPREDGWIHLWESLETMLVTCDTSGRRPLWGMDLASFYARDVAIQSWLRPTAYRDRGEWILALAGGDGGKGTVTGVAFYAVGDKEIACQRIGFDEPLDTGFFARKGLVAPDARKGLGKVFSKEPSMSVCECFFFSPAPDEVDAVVTARDENDRLSVFTLTSRDGKWQSIERQSTQGATVSPIVTGKEFACDGTSAAFVWCETTGRGDSRRTRAMRVDFRQGAWGRPVEIGAGAVVDEKVPMMWIAPDLGTAYLLKDGLLTAVSGDGRVTRYSAGDAGRIVDLAVEGEGAGPLAAICETREVREREKEIVALWDLSGRLPVFVTPVLEQHLLHVYRMEVLPNGHIIVIGLDRWGRGANTAYFADRTRRWMPKGRLLRCSPAVAQTGKR